MTPALDLLHRLVGDPRPAGSPEEAHAQEFASTLLADSGFSVVRQPFTYSAFVGRWATPLSGAVLTLAYLAVALSVAQKVDSVIIVLGFVAVHLIVAAFGAWSVRVGVMRWPFLRAEGHNLIATKGRPRVWFVAHTDSKSQPVAILTRALAISLLGVFAILIPIAVLRHSAMAIVLSLAASLCAFVVARCTVHARSPGARDNASGVATLLRLAQLLDQRTNVGIVLTSAEELALAGAHAWAATLDRHSSVPVINVDTIDDAGTWLCMWHGRRGRALGQAICARNAAFRLRRVLPGVLTDGVALGVRSFPAVTLSRGTLGTLARIHTPRDSVHGMRGNGIEELATILHTFVEGLPNV